MLLLMFYEQAQHLNIESMAQLESVLAKILLSKL
jgi:hypothetical protein